LREHNRSISHSTTLASTQFQLKCSCCCKLPERSTLPNLNYVYSAHTALVCVTSLSESFRAQVSSSRKPVLVSPLPTTSALKAPGEWKYSEKFATDFARLLSQSRGPRISLSPALHFGVTVKRHPVVHHPLDALYYSVVDEPQLS